MTFTPTVMPEDGGMDSKEVMQMIKSKVRTKVDAFAAKHPVLTTICFATIVFVSIGAIRAAMMPSIEHYQEIMAIWTVK